MPEIAWHQDRSPWDWFINFRKHDTISMRSPSSNTKVLCNTNKYPFNRLWFYYYCFFLTSRALLNNLMSMYTYRSYPGHNFKDISWQWYQWLMSAYNTWTCQDEDEEHLNISYPYFVHINIVIGEEIALTKVLHDSCIGYCSLTIFELGILILTLACSTPSSFFFASHCRLKLKCTTASICLKKKGKLW